MLPLQGSMLAQILFQFPPQNLPVLFNGDPNPRPEKEKITKMNPFLLSESPAKENRAPEAPGRLLSWGGSVLNFPQTAPGIPNSPHKLPHFAGFQGKSRIDATFITAQAKVFFNQARAEGNGRH